MAVLPLLIILSSYSPCRTDVLWINSIRYQNSYNKIYLKFSWAKFLAMYK